jgi:hypothetical protein
MILFAVLSALSALCSNKLPETLHKTPADVVEELQVDLTSSILTNPEETSDLHEILLGKAEKTSTNYSRSEPDLDA